MKPIKVLIADDSPLMRSALARIVASDRDLQVVGLAVDGLDAVEQVKALQPDVVTLDIEMPRMNGLEALTRIMSVAPRPVIMLSSLSREGTRTTLDALDRGAFDFIAKPGAEAVMGIMDIREELLAKIKNAAHSPLVRPSPPPARKEPAKAVACTPARVSGQPAVIAIGTSTGGPKALQEVLSQLPQQLPAGILVVQHMPLGFTSQFAERLNHICKVAVRESKGDELVESGTVYIAPAGTHLTVYRSGTACRTQLSKSPADTLHTPSVDVLMNSVAKVYGSKAMGVLLTGMGNDGALGMKAVRDAGGWTIGQDAESCAVYGMPRAAAELNALCRVAPLTQIAAEILAVFSQLGSAASASARTGR